MLWIRFFGRHGGQEAVDALLGGRPKSDSYYMLCILRMLQIEYPARFAQGTLWHVAMSSFFCHFST